MIDNQKKKAFDSTVCFSFFGSWLNTLERLETANEKNSMSYMLFKAIAYYSLYGIEPEFDMEDERNNITCGALWEVIGNEIDNSIKNRKRWFADECPTEKQRAIIAECIKHPDASLRDIAAITGTSKSLVSSTKKRYKKMILDGTNSPAEEPKKAELHVLRGAQYVQNADEYNENDLPF